MELFLAQVDIYNHFELRVPFVQYGWNQRHTVGEG
jgi:hypothetical protein